MGHALLFANLSLRRHGKSMVVCMLLQLGRWRFGDRALTVAFQSQARERQPIHSRRDWKSAGHAEEFKGEARRLTNRHFNVRPQG